MVRKAILVENLLKRIEYENKIEDTTTQLLEYKSKIKAIEKKNEVIWNKYKRIATSFKPRINELNNLAITLDQKLSQTVASNLKRKINDVHIRSNILLDTNYFKNVADIYNLELECVDLKELFVNNLYNFNAYLSEKSINPHLNLSDSVPFIKSDKNAINLILFNLLYYTTKYMPNGENLNLTLESNEDTIFLEIESRRSTINADVINDDVYHNKNNQDLKLVKKLTEEMNASFHFSASHQMGLKFILQF